MTRLERDRPDSLSVPEMLRIMDVATALRQDRELVEEQLNVEALKERLKERMLAASKVTGESVTPEEVDAAIKQYYASLYTFREPKLTFPVALAHLWVRRVMIGWIGGATLVSAAMLWTLYLSPNARLSTRGKTHRLAEKLAVEVAGHVESVRSTAKGGPLAPEVARLAAEAEAYRKKDDPNGLESVRQALNGVESRLREVDKLSGEIADLAETIPALARDVKVAPEVARLAAEAEVYRNKDDAQGLGSIRDALANLKSRLDEEYSVTAVVQNTVSGRNKSTIDRDFPDKGGKKLSGHYLFVQARKADGTVLPRQIYDNELYKDKEVTVWAERIPDEVFERLKKDKLADGILNETAFAVKRRGMLDEEITMPGADGKPIARLGRITEW